MVPVSRTTGETGTVKRPWVCLGVAEKLGFQRMDRNREADHMQLPVEVPPTLSVSSWTPSHFAASAGAAPLETPGIHVEAQDKPS